MALSMEQSELRYQRVKEHFQHLIGKRAIVIMSDLPLNHWQIIFRKSDQQMWKEKSQIIGHDCPFTEFYSHLSGNLFLYDDENLLKSEELKTGEINYFYDKRISERHLELIQAELKALSKAS